MTDANTTSRLLEAAERRMRRGGYNAVSFRDLASDTAIKSSSVHYHYPRKEDLGVALIDRYSKRFFEAANAIAEDVGDPTGKLNALRSVYRNALTDDEAICLCGLLGAEMAGLPETIAQSVQAFFRANIEWVETALPEGLSDAERHERACGIVAVLQGAMMLAHSLDDQDIFDNATERAIDVAAAKV